MTFDSMVVMKIDDIGLRKLATGIIQARRPRSPATRIAPTLRGLTTAVVGGSHWLYF